MMASLVYLKNKKMEQLMFMKIYHIGISKLKNRNQNENV